METQPTVTDHERSTGGITALSASEIARRIAARELSVHEAIDAHIRRIEAVDSDLNAVVLPRFQQAREEAIRKDKTQTESDSKGPLWGVPVTIKEGFHVSGMPTSIGLSKYRHATADDDAPLVARLRKDDLLSSAKVLRKRDHEYVSKKIPLGKN